MADDRFNLRRKAATSGGAGGTARGRSKSRGRVDGAKSKPKLPEKRVYTPDDQTKLLKSYINVPRDFWDDLTEGSHVRYYVKGHGAGPVSEAFRIGGYITRAAHTWRVRDEPNDRRGIRLRTSISYRKGAKVWSVTFSNVRDIFVRSDPASILVRREIATHIVNIQGNEQRMAARIRQLITAVQDLSQRLAAVESRIGGAVESRIGGAVAPPPLPGARLTAAALATHSGTARGRGGEAGGVRHRSKSRHSHRSHRSRTSDP